MSRILEEGQEVMKKENAKFKLALLCLKTDLVSHPTVAVGVL